MGQEAEKKKGHTGDGMGNYDWGERIMSKGFMQVPRALMLKRAELGLKSNEYAVLLDYISYYAYTGSVNPYEHLAEVNGVGERTIQKIVRSLEGKGLLKREVTRTPGDRVDGVVFRIEPLVRKLEALMKKASPYVGEESFTGVDEQSAGDNNEDIYNIYNINKNVPDSARGYSEELREADGGGYGEAEKKDPADGGKTRKKDFPHSLETADNSDKRKPKKWKDPYCATRWYNEVFSTLYEDRAGQPVLAGGREYRSAETYFARLRELNPDFGPEKIYALATEGALFMLDSQLSGGVFGWLHKPPDICLLASQAQAVDYHLRKVPGRGEGELEKREGGTGKNTVFLEFRHKEAYNEGKRIEKLLGELDEIDRVSAELQGRKHYSGEGGEPPPAGEEEGQEAPRRGS